MEGGQGLCQVGDTDEAQETQFVVVTPQVMAHEKVRF